jgi:hypothetical protein
MRTMYDALSTQAHTIPADAQLVAGYIDAGPVPAAPPWTAETWALFPHAVHVTIATQPGTNDGLVLDVEAGDATPEQAPAWVAMRRAAGVHPTVYCSESDWPEVRDAFTSRGIAEPEWWIAGAPGSVGQGNLYAGSVAHQYGDNAAGTAAATWDISAVADHWPGVDTGTPSPNLGDDDVKAMLAKLPDDDTVWICFRSSGTRRKLDNKGGERTALVSDGVLDAATPARPVTPDGVAIRAADWFAAFSVT